jgi:adenylate cyclase
MNILDRIEEQVSLPGDTETQRSRKVLGFLFLGAVALVAGVPALWVWATNPNGNGPQAFAVGLVLAGLTALIWFVPRSYNAVIGTTALGLLLFIVADHFFWGGYRSGVYNLVWTLLVPIGAVLLMGPRLGLVALVAFLGTLGIVSWLELSREFVPPPTEFRLLVALNASNMAGAGVLITLASLYLLRQIERYRVQANDLLLNVLPGSIAMQLKRRPGTIADDYDEVTVLFADIVDFTQMSATAHPVEVVNFLNEVFSSFDLLAERHGLEKIKTIGDAYMVAAGLPEPREDHTEAIVAFAIDMLASLEGVTGLDGSPIRLRVGINTGPVVAGVIGRQKFIYDLWGDAVNVASRMESNGLTNQIQVTEAVKKKLDGRYTFDVRDPIPIKGKGMMTTYLLKPQPTRGS